MKRRKAREYALQMLFQLDFTARTYDKKDLEEFWSDKKEKSDVKRIRRGAGKGNPQQPRKDRCNDRNGYGKLVIEKDAAVDRNILRFAAYEILFRKDIPSAVTINEALEIAKKYSTQRLPLF